MYIEIFFWVAALFLLALSTVHFSKVLKNNDKVHLTKAILYISAASTLVVLLVYKPFSSVKLAKMFKPDERLLSAETVMIATSLSTPDATVVSV